MADTEAIGGGTALCLSGGGYRAMLFHVGVLLRLNEAAMLRDLDRVSSVSGGSITAGVLASRWSTLSFGADGVATNLDEALVDPVRAMAHVDIDVGSVLTGLALPFHSISDRVVKTFREHLFGETDLQDLPDSPRFVFNATNLESGVLMRFSKPYLADYRVGMVKEPTLLLALAVTASSAFPPFLSPCTVDLTDADWTTEPGNDLDRAEFRGKIQLSDGGVYDNLGLQSASAYRTLLVSDAGGALEPDADPPAVWLTLMVRVLKVIDSQVRSLRKRHLIDGFESGEHDGMYVGIRSDVDDYKLADPIAVDPRVTDSLAAIPTRLDEIDDTEQELLVNWGYAICDTGLRAHVRPDLPKGTLPYPEHPLSSAQGGTG